MWLVATLLDITAKSWALSGNLSEIKRCNTIKIKIHFRLSGTSMF